MFEAISKSFLSFVALMVEREATGISVDGLSIFRLLAMALALAFLTAGIARNKGGSSLKWFFAGALVGVIALPMAIFKRKKITYPGQKQCPNCAQKLPIQAILCDACDFNFLSMAVGNRYKPIPAYSEHLTQ
jgi:hypothetical protein